MNQPKTMTDSHIDIHKTGGTAFVGPDAINLFRAVTLASALKLYAKTGLVSTRGITITKMLAFAKAYTGKTYKRGEAMKAHEDMRVWIETMKAALPTTVDGVQV